MTRGLKKRVVLFIMTLIALVPSVGYTQGFSFGSVDGRVRVHDGETGTVWVQLQRLGVLVQEQLTVDGRFTFRNVPNGTYTLSIRVPGQEPISENVSVPGESHVVIEISSRIRVPVTATTSVVELQIPRSARREYEH